MFVIIDVIADDLDAGRIIWACPAHQNVEMAVVPLIQLDVGSISQSRVLIGGRSKRTCCRSR
jgi:hypothetical protein